MQIVRSSRTIREVVRAFYADEAPIQVLWDAAGVAMDAQIRRIRPRRLKDMRFHERRARRFQPRRTYN